MLAFAEPALEAYQYCTG